MNIIPDFCEVEFDRRVMPGECSKNVLREMECFVSNICKASSNAIRIESPFTLEPMDSETRGDLIPKADTFWTFGEGHRRLSDP